MQVIIHPSDKPTDLASADAKPAETGASGTEDAKPAKTGASGTEDAKQAETGASGTEEAAGDDGKSRPLI